MDSLLKNLREFKRNIEENKLPQENILDINYYGNIDLFKNNEVIKEELYLVKKQVDGKTKMEFCTNYGIIAQVEENGQIKVSEQYRDIIDEKKFLTQLKSVLPLSLLKLEELEKKKQKNINHDNVLEKEDKEEQAIEKDNERKGPLYEEKSKDAIIDLNKKITETKTFKDLVPEARGLDKVVARRIGNSQFEIIGVNDEGEEVKLKTLEQTEGISPNKNVIELKRKDEKVVASQNQVMTMIKIKNGENEGRQDEGFTINLGQYGIPEVQYYRRAYQTNEYTSIPVNLENTSQKITKLQEREYIEKKRNTTVDDNIIRAQERIKYNENDEVELENIDDDPYNDKIVDESEIIIREAAKRCKMDVESFKKELEKTEGDSLEEKIENTEDKINEQFRGDTRNRA